MTTTLAGVPRVKAQRRLRAKPDEPTSKRMEPIKKKRALEPDLVDDLTISWRKR